MTTKIITRKTLSSTKKKSSKSGNKKSRRPSAARLLVPGREAAPKPSGRTEAVRNPESQIRQTGRPDSKQSRLVDMLQKPSGTTIDAMMQVTGWQPHSVRGFLAGIVRKKLGLNLVSEANKSGRIYRIDGRLAGNKINEAA